MKIKRPGKKTIIKWAIWSLVGILFLTFLIRVATFENAYYNEKEGSERAVVEDIGDGGQEELIEEKPAEAVPGSEACRSQVPEVRCKGGTRDL